MILLQFTSILRDFNNFILKLKDYKFSKLFSFIFNIKVCIFSKFLNDYAKSLILSILLFSINIINSFNSVIPENLGKFYILLEFKSNSNFSKLSN
jgi:hypothetical protein